MTIDLKIAQNLNFLSYGLLTFIEDEKLCQVIHAYNVVRINSNFTLD